MTDPTLLRRAIESVGIEKPSDYTLVMEEVERLMDEQIMFTSSELEKIDDWRFANRIGSRAEAIRRLLQAGMEKEMEGKG